MQDLIFSEHLTFPIFPSFRDGSYEYSLLYTVLEKASRITVDGQCVSLEQTITQGWEWLTWESENRFHSGTIATDVWTGIYEQYDAVDTLLPLVSPHIRDIWPGADLDTHALMFDERHSGVYLKEMLDICVLPDKDHYVDSSVSDILLQLQETPEHRQIHNLHRSPHSPNLSKRYVIYCYLAPKKLTQEQENFVTPLPFTGWFTKLYFTLLIVRIYYFVSYVLIFPTRFS